MTDDKQDLPSVYENYFDDVYMATGLSVAVLLLTALAIVAVTDATVLNQSFLTFIVGVELMHLSIPLVGRVFGEGLRRGINKS